MIPTTIGDPVWWADRIHPDRTALVIVDVQNDFCHVDGLFGRRGYDLSTMPSMASPLRDLVKAARQHDLLVVFVRATYDEIVLGEPIAENYRERQLSGLCLEGSWGAGWYAGLEPVDRPHEVVVTKHRYSPFVGTPLDLYLRSNRIRTVIVTGVVTSGCVESAVRDAFFRDYFVVVPADCVASPARAAHDASLRKIAESFGVVTESGVLIETWSRAMETNAVKTSLGEHGAGRNSLETRLDPFHTALVLVDLQNDFCHPAGAMGRRGEDLRPIQAILPTVEGLLARARRAKLRVFHVRAEYGPLSSSDVTAASLWDDPAYPCCRPGSWGAEFLAEVRPVAGEATIVKHRYSAFVDTSLDLLLRTGRIRTVVVAGVATHCCVESTARDANMRDYHVVIPEDAVAARGGMEHLHRASLETLGRYFGTVATTGDITKTWLTHCPGTAH